MIPKCQRSVVAMGLWFQRSRQAEDVNPGILRLSFCNHVFAASTHGEGKRGFEETRAFTTIKQINDIKIQEVYSPVNRKTVILS